MNRLSFRLIYLRFILTLFPSLTCTFLNAQVPLITSFSPESGPVGTTVTITGTNFNPVPANNIVWFGAVKAAVTAASATELSVTVPERATYQHITVTVNGLTAYASSLFNFTFASSKIIDASSFSPRVDFNTGTSPGSSALADLDGDGKTDLIVVNHASNSISVFRYALSSNEISPSSFNLMAEFSTGSGPTGITAGDIDGDGKTDIAVTNSGSNSISVFRNISTSGSISAGSFEAKVDFTTGNSPYDVAIRDIDGDGKPDLIVTNSGGNSVSVLQNLSTPGTLNAGSFNAKVDLATGMSPHRVTVEDIDGDGKPDLAVNNLLSNSITVYRNISLSGTITTGSFETSIDFTTGMAPWGLSLCDIDGNGKKDLIVNYSSNQIISIFKNISITGMINAGSFDNRVDIPLSVEGPGELTTGDIDGDGRPDLAVSNPVRNTVSVFRNTSTYGSVGVSSFSPGVEFPAGTGPNGIEIGDLNGDSKPELVVVNNGNNNVSVLRNTMPLPSKPAISSVVPSFGPVGTEVIITGTNFSTEPTENIVWFGAVQAMVTSATSTQLIVTVPTGAAYQPITVTADGVTGYSNKPFNVTFLSTRIIDATAFAAKVDFPTGTMPVYVATGDIDCDGKPDLAIANVNGGTVSVYRSTSISGSITADSRVDLITGGSPRSIVIGDIDGDGKPDLAVTNDGSNIVSVFRNKSTPGSLTPGSFAARVDFTTGTKPIGVAIGDIDGDGKPDLVITNYADNNISVFRNTGNTGSITTGSFAGKVDFTTGTAPFGVAIGDIDGDSKPDLTVANYTSSTVSIFRNTSTSGTINASSFASKYDLTPGSGTGPVGVAISDIDGDGKPDLAVTNNTNSSVSVFRNTSTSGYIGAGSFATKVDFTTGSYPYFLSISDIDGDGKPDIAVANLGDNSVSVLRNTSTSVSITNSSFAEKADFSTDLAPYGIVIGDLDGDSKPDIIVTNSGGNNISVLRNALQAPVPPVIDSFTPASGAVGAAVTINGSGFSTTLSDNFVWFGPVKAAVIAATPTQLTVTVPPGAAYQPITVTVNGMTASSGSPFIPAFAGTSEITALAFSTTIDLTVGMFPSSFAAGDIDEDGKPDLFVTNTNSNSISAFRNTNTAGSISPGMFGPRVDIASGMNPQGIVTCDIDCDGKLDLIVANGTTSSTVSVYRNNGTSGSVTGGSFDPRVDLITGVSSIDVATGDIDGDGKPDLVISNFNSNYVSIYRNISTPGSITTGSFAPRVDFAVDQYLQNIVLADIDGDRKPDLIAPLFNNSAVSVYRNISTIGSVTIGSFAPKVDFVTGMDPLGVAVGDLDGDGKPEIVVANSIDNDLSVFHNISTPGTIAAGSFEPKTDFYTGGIRYVTIGDINGDSKPDLIYKNNENKVNVLKNNCTTGSIGPGSFASAVEFAADHEAAKTLLADFDCDGKPDIAYINIPGSMVSILRNKIAEFAVPVISSFSPDQGPPGTQVTIDGVNFSLTPGENIVRFGTVQAVVSSATETRLTVTVPFGASSGAISVTVNGQTAVSGTAFTVTEPLPLPVIAAFNPVYGPEGTVVTIIGNNFNPAAENNIVRFGAVRGQVLSASSTQITARVPSGATFEPLSVTSAGLTAYAQTAFNTTFPSDQVIDDDAFGQRFDFSVYQIYNLSLSDLDDDGKPDIVATTSGGNAVKVFRNRIVTGDISMGIFEEMEFGTGQGATCSAVGDIDNDGKQDIAVTNVYGNTVSVLRNTATPGAISASSFAEHVDFATGSEPWGVAIGDIDGDGKPDLAVTYLNENYFSIFRNTSTIGSITNNSFAPRVDFPVGNNARKIALCDIDGDRKPDIAVGINLNNAVSVFRNTSVAGAISQESFAPVIGFPVTGFPVDIAFGDLDGDGKPDMITANAGNSHISVLKNTSVQGSITSGSFGQAVEIPLSYEPSSIAMSDINGDNRPDFGISINSVFTHIFQNNCTDNTISAGSFSTIRFPQGGGTNDIAMGDINGDNKPDLILANLRNNSITLMQNYISGAAQPEIFSVTPGSGPAGSTVAIIGENFNPEPQFNTVMFGEIQAEVIQASVTQLVIIVPEGADGQTVSVTANGLTAYYDVPFHVTGTGTVELESSILTLNGDGINEIFRVKNFQIYGESKLRVYNSRAALVYWNDYFQGEWDVTLHNKRFETGGYFYVIETSIGTFRGSFSILK